jgi:CheY-like chemotaxis protein
MAIVKSHSGSIQVSSQVGIGTTFQVYLPATQNSEPEVKRLGKEPLARGGSQCLLLVDDETAILMIARRILIAAGYRVLTTQNGAEALAIYNQSPEAIEMVITDSMMPVMDGPSLIEALRQANPDVKVILMSGLTSKVDSQREFPAPNSFIRKPFTQDLLLETIEKVLRSKDL